MHLSNRFLSFECDSKQGVWNLRPIEGFPAILSARVQLRYRARGRSWEILDQAWKISEASEPETVASRNGAMEWLQLDLGLDFAGVEATLTFALPQSIPLLLWRIQLRNQSTATVLIDRITLLESQDVHLGEEVGEQAFFSNGWQSWSYSGIYTADQKQHRSRFGWLLDPTAINASTPAPKEKGHFTSDFFGILGDRSSRKGLLVGFLSQKEQFGSVEVKLGSPAALRLWADGDGVRLNPGKTVQTDWAAAQFIQLDDPDPLGVYMDAVAQEHVLDALKQQEGTIPVGWCSWYEFYQNIDEGKIRANLERVQQLRDDLPLQLVQIDDGFERQPGDWFEFRNGFPQGVAPLAREIRGKGFKPGLWLAPFIVHPQAHLVRRHPEYLLRNSLGIPVYAGFGWNSYAMALDLTRPDALGYACRVVETAVHEWGFPYLKLDFLYAAALRGKHADPTRTRAQILRTGLKALRSAAGQHTYLLGCGVPLGTSIGIFDAMRIGEDVSGEWFPRFLNIEKPFRQEVRMPSVRNALQNILARAPMHNRWWVNDPDCLIIRLSAELTLAEIQSMATAVALTGGSLLLSDNLTVIPEDRLRIAQALLPVIGVRPQVLDWFDRERPQRVRLDLEGPQGKWHLLAHFNWKDTVEDLDFRLDEYRLPGGNYLAQSFWDQQTIKLSDGVFRIPNVAAHDCILLAVRTWEIKKPLYVGSNLHVSQGLEIAGWEVEEARLVIKFSLPRKANGQVVLHLPDSPKRAWLDGNPVIWDGQGDNYRFEVAFDREVMLEVVW